MIARLRYIALIVLVATVAACSSGSEVPALTPESEAEMSARGLALLCDQYCIGQAINVSDHAYETVNPPVPGEPLSDVQQTAITRQLANVAFVNDEEAAAIHGEDGFVFVVGPVHQEPNGVARVEVSALGPSDVFSEVFAFTWNGQDWVQASSGSNVTVSTLP